jgi:nitroreductase
MDIENQLLDMVMNRRSIRNYTDQDITDEQVDVLLAAGCNAPSARAIHPAILLWSGTRIKSMN